MVGYGRMEDVLNTLEAAVTAIPFLASERFSVADVYTGGKIGRGLMFEAIPARPAFKDYWARVGQRRTRLEAKALDGALVGGV